MPPNAICYKLKKSIYGFKQACRQCRKKISASLLYLGFDKAHGDHILFVYQTNDDLVYVDDIIIVNTSDEVGTKIALELESFFKLRGLGFLGPKPLDQSDRHMTQSHTTPKVPHMARSDPTRSSLVAEANIRLKDQK